VRGPEHRIAYTDPSWVSDDDILVTFGNRGPEAPEQVGLVDVDDAEWHPWFSDPDATYKDPSTPVVMNLKQGVMTRAHDRVAFVATTWFLRFAEGPGSDNQIRIYAMDGEPPARPELQCTIDQPAEAFSRPTWSPDGTRLAWAEADGVHVATIGDAEDCNEQDAPLVLPGAKAPFWSPADLPTGHPAAADAGPQVATPPGTTPQQGAPPVQPTGVVRSSARCVVPRVRGKRLRVAKRLARAGGCRVKVKGRRGRRAVVRVQRPAAGTQLAAGAKVTLVAGRGR
jgi:hypothetical protein